MIMREGEVRSGKRCGYGDCGFREEGWFVCGWDFEWDLLGRWVEWVSWVGWIGWIEVVRGWVGVGLG